MKLSRILTSLISKRSIFRSYHKPIMNEDQDASE